MVRFEKDKLVIEIETAFPEEYVVELQRDLLRLMCAADKDMIDNDNDSVAGVCSFLEDLLAGPACRLVPETNGMSAFTPTCGQTGSKRAANGRNGRK